MSAGVDLVVNTFERSYREILRPGFFPRLVDQNRHRFARRTALINNVADRADADRRARALIDAGELDEVRHVADHLEAALRRTGLRASDLGRLAHYSDCSLVAVTLDGPPDLLYWDADVSLESAGDWITPSLALLGRDPRVLVCNPRWTDDVGIERVTIAADGDFTLGLGFSDQLYLVRRADLARPIYRDHCTASLRYPLSAVADVFEARVDSHMRHHGRLRATYMGARYRHPVQATGTATDRLSSPERLRATRNRLWLGLVERLPVKKSCCRYF